MRRMEGRNAERADESKDAWKDVVAAKDTGGVSRSESWRRSVIRGRVLLLIGDAADGANSGRCP